MRVFDVVIAGIHGEHTESEGGVYDVSNKRRLGLTEVQAVTEMYNGVKEFIKLEKELSWYVRLFIVFISIYFLWVFIFVGFFLLVCCCCFVVVVCFFGGCLFCWVGWGGGFGRVGFFTGGG